MTTDKATIGEAVQTATQLASSWGWINEYEAMGAGKAQENEWELFTHNAVKLRDQLSQIITSWGLNDTQPITTPPNTVSVEWAKDHRNRSLGFALVTTRVNGVTTQTNIDADVDSKWGI